jgi:DNA repair protein RadA
MAQANGSPRPQSVSDLPGLGPATVERLRATGYGELMSIAVASPAELAEAADLGEGVAQRLIEQARAAVDVGGFTTGDVLLRERRRRAHLATGSKALDELLGGGVEARAITEAAGEFGSGKTQLALQLCVNVQLPAERGGWAGEAAVIDTENTFRPERIAQIATAAGLNPDEVLPRVHVARAYNSAHQMMLVDKVAELGKTRPIRLVVVDSLTAHFRAEFVGRDALANRQQKLNTHMHDLLRLGDKLDAAIYCTNQVAVRPDILFGDATRAIGGHIVGHTATYRLFLRKGKGNRRLARLVDSPHLPEGEVVFTVDEKGVHD